MKRWHYSPVAGGWARCRGASYCWYPEHSSTPPPASAARRRRAEELAAMTPGERAADRAARARGYRARRKLLEEAELASGPEAWELAGRVAGGLRGLSQSDREQLAAWAEGGAPESERAALEAAAGGALELLRGERPGERFFGALRSLLGLALLRRGPGPERGARSGQPLGAPRLWVAGRGAVGFFLWLFEAYDGLLESLLGA